MVDGDSLSTGAGAGGNGYVEQIVAAYPTAYVVRNYASGGQTVTDLLADAATQVDQNYEARYFKNVVLVWIGANDLDTRTAEDTYADIVTYCQGRQSAGFQVIVFTQTIADKDATWLTKRLTLNGLIVANYGDFADEIVRLDIDPHIGDDGDPTNPVYFADTVHLAAAGYGIVAGLAKSAIDRLA